jgi:hypothetical protein
VTGKTWHAYLSTTSVGTEPAVSARDRIGDGPWFNSKGVQIAANLAQLHEENDTDNNLTAATALDERGNVVPGRNNRPAGVANEHDILTGSGADGRALTGTPNPNCANWTSDASSGAVAQVGHCDRDGLGANPTSWNTSHTTPGCSQQQLNSVGGAGRFYCFATD